MDNQTPEKKSTLQKIDNGTINILKVIIVGLLGFAFVMFVFGVGIWVGEKRAEFSFRWAEEYHRNFGGPNQGIFGNFPNSDFISGHGIFGTVLKIDGDSIIVKGQDDMETTIVVSGQTTVRDNVSAISLQDIKVNDTVVIIGSPDNQGQIEAKFIRVLPTINATFMQINNLNIYQYNI